jgi:hypothetical protein
VVASGVFQIVRETNDGALPTLRAFPLVHSFAIVEYMACLISLTRLKKKATEFLSRSLLEYPQV